MKTKFLRAVQALLVLALVVLLIIAMAK